MGMFENVVEAYARLGGNVSAVARELGVVRSTVQYHLRKSDIYDPARSEDDPVVHGTLDVVEPDKRALPTDGHTTYIFTSAQNNTKINEAVWSNLLALAEYHGAELIVGTYSYNINAYGSGNTKRGHEDDGEEGLWYDPRLIPYIEAGDDLNIRLCDTLQWCGRANVMPTAVKPLSGFETYCNGASGIFPHAKFALESLPIMKGEPTRMNYTTGTVTQRNYIARKAGLKAEHHHAYGAVIVEVDSEGDWFVRQLNADSEGTICDLNTMAWNGEIIEEVSVSAITWGDIHYSKMDEEVEALNWAPGGIFDTLSPDFQFIHDLIDFEARRHHDAKNPHKLFRLYVKGQDSVEMELREAAHFLGMIDQGNECKTIVVDSNHDNDLERWLREADFKVDPPNAVFYLECQLAKYRSMVEGEELHMIEHVMVEHFDVQNIKFLRPDESYMVEGIEQGMHGHLGPNGARGTPRNLSKITTKANTGHTHSAAIVDGCYVAGVSGKLEQGYNVGPSSWSNSHVVTYQNGKRCVLTIRNGKWRA
jgi:hypothetical protein